MISCHRTFEISMLKMRKKLVNESLKSREHMSEIICILGWVFALTISEKQGPPDSLTKVEGRRGKREKGRGEGRGIQASSNSYICWNSRIPAFISFLRFCVTRVNRFEWNLVFRRLWFPLLWLNEKIFLFFSLRFDFLFHFLNKQPLRIFEI